MKMKFKPGDPVLIEDRLIGIVLSGYLWTDTPQQEFLYRIVVDAGEAVSRLLTQSSMTQTGALHKEDLETLRWHTDKITVVERFENKLEKFKG